MKLKINKKLLLLAATSTLTLSGCGLDDSECFGVTPVVFEEISNDSETNFIGDGKLSYSAYLEKTLPETVVEEEPSIIVSDGVYVKATTNVNIRSEANTNSSKVDILGLGASAKIIGEVGNFYNIEYLGNTGYVSKDYVVTYDRAHVNAEPIDAVYFPNDAYIYDEMMDDKILVPKGEFTFVYEENDGQLLVDADGSVGYVDKTQVQHVDDTNNYVVVDISDQNVKVLNGKDILVDGPCITGSPKNPTGTGLFTVWRDEGMRHLVCDNSPWVNVMKSFDKNRGLHDAQNYVEENGFSHGWRELEEFGGTTYLTHGSHGCVNMTHDDAMALDKLITKGSKVLVKR